MIAIFSLLIVSQTPMTTVKAALPAFTSVGIPEALSSVYQDRFSATLSSPQLRVTSSRDIEQALGLERQKQLLGCSEGESCLAELAGALGVDVIISGSLAKSESGYICSLRAIRASDGQLVSSFSHRAKNEDALLDFFDFAAPNVRREILSGFGIGIEKVTPPAPSNASLVKWIPAFVGAAGLAVGAGLVLDARNQFIDLKNVPFENRVQMKVNDGERQEQIGFVVGAVGLGAITASVIWSLIPAAKEARISAQVLVNQQGSMVAFQGTF